MEIHLPFDFLLSRRPVSLQTRNRANLQKWIDYVRSEAAIYAGSSQPVSGDGLSVTLVYVCKEDPCDIDNIIKPILDGLVRCIYVDDSQVVHVQSYLVDLTEPVDITEMGMLLRAAVADGEDCVYVRVAKAGSLKEYL